MYKLKAINTKSGVIWKAEGNSVKELKEKFLAQKFFNQNEFEFQIINPNGKHIQLAKK